MSFGNSFQEISGILKKKGSKQGLWHKRFATLHLSLEGYFVLISKDNSSPPIQSIKIDHLTKILAVPDAPTPRFILENPNEEQNLFSTESDEENQRWVSTLQSVAAVNQKFSMEQFRIISVLGRGFYGKVMLCQKLDTKELFAIKTIQKARLAETGKASTVISEKNTMMKVHFPFMVNLCFAFQTSAKFYLGLEYAPGGELFYLMDRVGVIPLDDARLYIAEIGLTLSYLHAHGIIYRDLKPENVLLGADGHIKLTDFGLSKDLLTSDSTGTFCGTSEYLAPEIVLQQPYSFPVDIWALGILSYEMLLGNTPFCDENKSKMFAAIVGSEPEFPPEMDSRISDFISQLLTKDPTKRPTFDEMKSHPFFEGFDWNKILNKIYTPNFIPEINDPLKAENFDPEFTNEVAADSYVQAPMEGENIPGFSFTETAFPEEI